eukprot:TRINITY_DN10633_c0_g1_i2.p1 TRINITY_DN10633_c0_g1~~TRINITY_DN10633_c0_g1_i2.p1  ORF type:complete len:248 (+),score=59.68 TRINITY_DN10633_c0_g1_i2:169-912(+)
MSLCSYSLGASPESPNAFPLSSTQSISSVAVLISPKTNTSNAALIASKIFRHKVIFLGDATVGKTCILSRFMNDVFEETYQTTIGMDFQSRMMHFEDRTVALQLWDTAGQERYQSLIPAYLRDCSIAVVVYDITNRNSFLNTSRWAEQVQLESGPNTAIVVVGNKQDLGEGERREVTLEEGEQKAVELKAQFLETSAKSGFNIRTLFYAVISELPTNMQQQKRDTVNLTSNPTSNERQGQSRKSCRC